MIRIVNIYDLHHDKLMNIKIKSDDKTINGLNIYYDRKNNKTYEHSAARFRYIKDRLNFLVEHNRISKENYKCKLFKLTLMDL